MTDNAYHTKFFSKTNDHSTINLRNGVEEVQSKTEKRN